MKWSRVGKKTVRDILVHLRKVFGPIDLLVWLVLVNIQLLIEFQSIYLKDCNLCCYVKRQS